MKKFKIKKKVLIIGIIIIAIIAILLLISRITKNSFLGTWITDGGTIYEFKEKNVGVMKTSLSEYKFTYKIKDDVLSIDFEEENVIDTNYKYSFENNKCILTSDRGNFTFTKK